MDFHNLGVGGMRRLNSNEGRNHPPETGGTIVAVHQISLAGALVILVLAVFFLFLFGAIGLVILIVAAILLWYAFGPGARRSLPR